MNKEGHENREAQLRIRVIGCESDEAFREFVEGDSYGCLKTDGKEGVRRDMVMMAMRWIICRVCRRR